jgi:RNA-directed DNA polymerase
VPSVLLKKVWSTRSLERAWRVIEENSRTSKSEDVKKEVAAFREEASTKLRSLSGRLSHKSFVFAPAKGIAIPKSGSGGKVAQFRPIVLANVECRIVQRSILNVLLDVPDLQKYIHTPHSFGGIRKKSENDLAAVPAAISAVLGYIGAGSNFVICADISKFFTRIPKPTVTAIVADAVKDDEFMQLFKRAITVELSNLAELREKAEAFPIYDIGVAQGNSLSSLLGNILLHDFDRQMNEGDCHCIRYIDDVIILAPTRKAATARLKKAEKILAHYKMNFGAEKTHREPTATTSSFEFLGIELSNGLIRPAAKAQIKFLKSLDANFEQSKKALIARRNGEHLKKERSVLATLRRADGMIQGWGKHYRFCNDISALENLDAKVTGMIRAYIGVYSATTASIDDKARRNALGVDLLSLIELKPLKWPKRGATKIAGLQIVADAQAHISHGQLS